MSTLLWVAAGGGAGAVLRFLLHGALQGSAGASHAFPFGTLCVNVLGCALIGAAAGWLDGLHPPRDDLRALCVVGLLGGFTTFSTFSLETLRLLDAGRAGLALTYVVASNTLGLLAAWASSLLTR